MPPLPRRRSLAPVTALSVLLGLATILVPSAVAQPDRDAEAPRIDVRFEPQGPIGVDETVRLTVQVALSSGRRVAEPRFQVENLELLQGPSTSQSIRFVNGVSSHSFGFTWFVKPRRIGEARVTGGQVRIGDLSFDVPATSVRVVEEPPPRSRARRDPFGSFFDRDRDSDPFGRERPPPRREREPPKIFLEAEITPRSPYVGQQAVYTLYLYTDVNVRSVSPTDLPEFKGFWATPIPQPDNAELEQVVRDGEGMGRAVLLQRALFPRRAGELEVGPVEAQMLAVVSRGWGLPRSMEVRRRSNATQVTVRPLPEPRPDGFRGVVGEDLDLEVSLEPRELEIGDAATLELVLDGRGHLQGVPAPEIGAGGEVEIFPPQQKSDHEIRGRLFYSTRQWSYVVVPQTVGAIELPPIEVPYFDPRRGEYRVAASEPMHLAVRGATRANRSAEGADQAVELHPIRDAALPSVPERAPGAWPAARHGLFGAPLALGLLLLFLRRRGLGFGGAGERRAARRELLRALDEAAGEERPRQFAASVEESWRRFLDARWDVPSGTPSTAWSGLLVEHGASRDPAEELVSLADDLHYLRYAPKLSSTDEIRRELLERSKRLARRLS